MASKVVSFVEKRFLIDYDALSFYNNLVFL